MLEFLVLAFGIPYLLWNATLDNSKEEIKNNSQDDKTNIKKELRNKLDNMTTHEIDHYLKENYLHNYYDGYDKEAKIEKIIDRKMSF